MYVPWFPFLPEEYNYISYIHQHLHHVTGEDVAFPDSSWSYMKNPSPFEQSDRSDQNIHFRVLDALYKNKSIDGSQIYVLVHNGMVNLTGYVASDNERKEVEKTVRELKEVWSVENQLFISKDRH